MKIYRNLLFSLAPAAALLLCGCGGPPEDKALALRSAETVYMGIDSVSTALSMRQALAGHGYGKVTTANSKIFLQLADSGTGRAAVLYTGLDRVPVKSSFMAQRVWQAYERALNEPDAGGIVVNPGLDGSYLLTREQIAAALPKMPRTPELSVAISRKIAQ